MFNIRRLCLVFLVSIVALVGCSKSTTQTNDGAKSEPGLDYPTKPISFIVPYAAGGSTDVVARGIAEYAKDYLGESLVVENVVGAGGTVGVTQGISSKADGYTMTMSPAAAFTALPHSRDLTFNLDDVEALISFHNAANVLITKADSPYKTVEDLVKAAQSGKTLKYGNSGAGNFGHLALETFFKELEGKHSYIPYDGSSPAIAALLGGHIDTASVHPSEVKAHVEDGKIKILGIFGPERLAEYPDVPTIGEAFKGVGIEYPYASHDFAVWMFGSVPKDTPKEITEFLTDALRKTLNDQEFIDFTKKTDIQIEILEGDEIKNRLKQEYEVYGEIIKALDM